MNEPRIVTRDEWLTARLQLLAKEKALTRAHDALAAERRRLPMVRVQKPYAFDTPAGRRTLSELFAGRTQLAIYHFMMGPGWPEGCPSCSLVGDHLDGALTHLAQRDVTLVAVSRAPLREIEAFRQRMGWRFAWVSSHDSDFNRDFHVSFTKEELAGEMYYNYRSARKAFPSDEAPGMSVFLRSASGDVFHTYSTYARGGEPLLGVYAVLDLVPKGRDEDTLPFPMAWVRHHDRYPVEVEAPEPAAVPHDCCGARDGVSA